MRLKFGTLINVKKMKVSPLDGSNARSENDTFYPHPDEGEEGTECKMNVGIVSSRLLNHAAQLGIAVSSW